MEDQVLQLKREALRLKKEGKLEEAKEALARARELELSHVDMDTVTDVATLKKLALVLKRQGDIDGAKEALRKAKELEGASQSQAQSSSLLQTCNELPVVPPTPPAESEVDDQVENDQEMEGEGDEDDAELLAEYETLHQASVGDDHSEEDGDENSVEDADLLAEYSRLDKEEEDDGHLEEEGEEHPFDDEELMNVEMLEEMLQVGMALPLDHVYEERILANKQLALAKKRAGDIEQAKSFLKTAKQLEVAHVAVKKLRTQEALDSESLDDVQSELGDEHDDGDGMENMEGNEISLEDLSDPDMVAEMLAIGMKLPDPNALVEKAKEKKRQAVLFKNQGDLDQAKAALRESKQLQEQAEKVATALGKPLASQPQSKSSVSEVETSVESEKTVKTAEELKQEAIALKKADRLQEAAATYRAYKAALEKEAKAAQAAAKEALRQDIQKEIGIAKSQVKLYEFYQLWCAGNEQESAQQKLAWAQYEKNLTLKASKLDASDLASLSAKEERGLIRILDGIESMANGMDPFDNHMEICLLSAFDLGSNKLLEQLGSSGVLRAQVSVQLPKSENDLDSCFEMTFDSATLSGGTEAAFMQVGRILVPRGESKHARMVLRRMQRKRVEVSIFHVVKKEAQSSGGIWGFGRSSSKPQDEELTFVGKCCIELNHFLTESFLEGDLPLMDRGNRRPVGGFVRLGLRTGRPFGPASSPTQHSKQPIRRQKHLSFPL